MSHIFISYSHKDPDRDYAQKLEAALKEQGFEVWLELGLQSADDATLERVNRGHGFAEYRRAVRAAQLRELPVCTHLIVGLPGEGREAALPGIIGHQEGGVVAN